MASLSEAAVQELVWGKQAPEAEARAASRLTAPAVWRCSLTALASARQPESSLPKRTSHIRVRTEAGWAPDEASGPHQAW